MKSDVLLTALRAVAEPTRLRLLAICANGELTVSEITRITGQSQPRISRHLKVLTEAGLLDRFREQHWVFYRVPMVGEAAQLIRRVLALLSKEDDAQQLDGLRAQQIIRERADRVSGFLSDRGAAEVATITGLADGELAINAAVLETLNGDVIGKLLDIGTGTGRMLKLLGHASEEATGVDISKDMLMVARTNIYQAGIKNCTIRHGDMYHLRFTDASFDTVSIDLVLHQADEPARVIQEAARVLKPGGNVLILDVAKDLNAQPSGVSLARIMEWCEGAGLSCLRTLTLETNTRPVVLSLAQRQVA